MSSVDERSSSDLLSRLIEERVHPLSERIIRMKLGVSLRRADDRRVTDDARDLVSEVKTLMIGKLSKLRSGAANGQIDNFDAYVRAVTINVCNQYLRAKYPNRLRLKNQLRYLLSHDGRFAIGQAEPGGALVCSLSEWDERASTDDVHDMGLASLYDKVEQDLAAQRQPPELMDIGDLVLTILRSASDPVRLADLVAIIYQIRRITERSEVTGDEMFSHNTLISADDAASRVEDADFLHRLWEEIGELPLRHRAALLLNLKNAQGDGLITLLPVTCVASISDIAEMLEFKAEDFARIWSDLPWDDLAIASHLGITRQQVINLRQSARVTLRRRMER